MAGTFEESGELKPQDYLEIVKARRGRIRFTAVDDDDGHYRHDGQYGRGNGDGAGDRVGGLEVLTPRLAHRRPRITRLEGRSKRQDNQQDEQAGAQLGQEATAQNHHLVTR
jgi:hypothetical protein